MINRIDVINEILEHYKVRKDYINALDLLLSNQFNEQVLKDAEEKYITDKVDDLGIESLRKLKAKLERKIVLRDLLLDQLTYYERRILNMRFDMKMEISQIVHILYISESTYYRKMKIIYRKLIKYLDLFEDLFL